MKKFCRELGFQACHKKTLTKILNSLIAVFIGKEKVHQEYVELKRFAVGPSF